MSKDDQAKPATARTDTDRRRFFGDVIRGVSALACIGLPLGLLAKRSAARPAEAIRPPGAGAEDDFLAACVRCGLCVRDCPYDTLRLAGVEEPVATGTPFFIARDVPCEMCEDIPCVAACPTGALDKDLTQIDDARMGTAVIVGHETCLNYQGLRCDVCYRICPLINEAITLERQANLRTGKHALFIPVVHSDKCTGCGKCEKACVLQEAAIKVLPTKIATGELGAHYRWGWVEKEKAGKSLLNRDILDLPDRRPGGGGS
jgi:ferredoxin-type protein NapG